MGLQQVEYSLNGGQSWNAIALTRLPFKFTVPGSGFIHLIARAYDEAGQLAAKDARFIVNSACDQGGTPRLGGALFQQGNEAPGVKYVDVNFTNSGQGSAGVIRIGNVVTRTTAGTGNVTLDITRTHLPISLPDLLIGQSASVRLYFNVQPTVTRFSVTESGSLTDKFGRPLTFSTAQSVIVK